MINLAIDGWTPTPLEQSLMDGTFDKEMDGKKIPDIPEDLIEVQEFSEAMEDLRREIASWEDAEDF